MTNPVETSLDNMADISKVIMQKAVERGTLNEADIVFLAMYRKEKTQATYVPIYKKMINGAKELIQVVQSLNPKEEEKDVQSK